MNSIHTRLLKASVIFLWAVFIGAFAALSASAQYGNLLSKAAAEALAAGSPQLCRDEMKTLTAINDKNVAARLESARCTFVAAVGNAFTERQTKELIAAGKSPADAKKEAETTVQLALTDALSNINQAISINKTSSPAYNLRGAVYSAQGKNKEARADFDLAVELDSGNLRAYANRGKLKDEAGDQAGAVADYEKAVALGINDPFINQRLPELKQRMNTAAQSNTSADKSSDLYKKLSIERNNLNSITDKASKLAADRNQLASELKLITTTPSRAREITDRMEITAKQLIAYSTEAFKVLNSWQQTPKIVELKNWWNARIATANKDLEYVASVKARNQPSAPTENSAAERRIPTVEEINQAAAEMTPETLNDGTMLILSQTNLSVKMELQMMQNELKTASDPKRRRELLEGGKVVCRKALTEARKYQQDGYLTEKNKLAIGGLISGYTGIIQRLETALGQLEKADPQATKSRSGAEEQLSNNLNRAEEIARKGDGNPYHLASHDRLTNTVNCRNSGRMSRPN